MYNQTSSQEALWFLSKGRIVWILFHLLFPPCAFVLLRFFITPLYFWSFLLLLCTSEVFYYSFVLCVLLYMTFVLCQVFNNILGDLSNIF